MSKKDEPNKDTLQELWDQLERYRAHVDILEGELSAFQFILASVLREVGHASPETLAIILKGFDGAANAAEKLAFDPREGSRNFSQALKTIEDLRRVVENKD